ncbi:MAG: hypothetical protein ACR2NM_15440 [Bythopirellula sp.]
MPKPPPLQTLAHPVGVLYEVRWSEVCPWLILVKALRVTLLIRVLLLALVGALLAQWGSLAMGSFFSSEAPSLDRPVAASPASSPVQIPLPAEQPVNQVLAYAAEAPLLRGWTSLTRHFYASFDRELAWQQSLLMVAQGCWIIAVWAIFGGAIARIAALYVTRGETIGPIVALRDATTAWPSTAGAPLISVLFGLALVIPLVVLSFLLRLNSIAAIVGILWVVVLAWGLLLAVVFLGLMIGWPLMWACQGVERSDAFDGVSRCGAYVYQKPIQLAFYILIAGLLTYLSEAVVQVFADSAIALAEWSLSWGMGSARADEVLGSDLQTPTSSIAARAIQGWKQGVELLLKSFPLACLWSMSVGIYLLMRRHVDSTEMDEVTLSDGTKQAGLPKLKATAAGAAEAESPASNGDDQPQDE